MAASPRPTLRVAAADPLADDSRRIWAWRNDPTTRAMSRSESLILWRDHVTWYRWAANDPRRVLLIAELDGDPIATVRFDLENFDVEDVKPTPQHAEISVNLDPARRGQGLGGSIIAAACDYAWKKLGLTTIGAAIKAENAPSIRVFESLGFALRSENKGLRWYELARR